MVVTSTVSVRYSAATPDEFGVDSSVMDAVRHLVRGAHSRTDKGLTCPVTDDFLLRFVMSSDKDIKKAYHLVVEYFSARRDYPAVFLLGDPHSYLPIFRSSELGYELEDRDPLGRRMFVAKVGDMDPSRHKFEDILQSVLMTLEALSVEPDVQKLGIVILVDLTRFTYSLVRWLTPYKIKVSLKFLQDCIPIKMQALYCINAPRVFNLTYQAVKPLMKEEFRKKISWHNGNLSSLHSILPRNILPAEFGGTRDLDNNREWYLPVLQKAPMFKELRNFGYVNGNNVEKGE